MSFSSEVKEELGKVMPAARHCRIAEIAAIMSLCGSIQVNEFDEYQIRIRTENLLVARKFAQLLEAAFGVRGTVRVVRRMIPLRARNYFVVVEHPEKAEQILQALKAADIYGRLTGNSGRNRSSRS